jgi:hypothetical protein
MTCPLGPAGRDRVAANSEVPNSDRHRLSLGGPRWPPSGKAKGLVGDQALLVEVGRLELPCLVIHVYRHHPALMAESGR